MASIFSSTKNTRTILPDNMRFVRSDVPDNLTEQEIQWLIENEIVTIIDLREEAERNHKRCPLIDNKAFRYLCMPVTGGNTVPKSVDEVSKSYIKMVDNQMDRIIDTAMNSSANVLYFCNAGKDRTGVVSAILLYKLGISREYIIRDYVESGKNLKEILNTYAEQFPDVNKDVITPQKRYMEEFLDWLEVNHKKS